MGKRLRKTRGICSCSSPRCSVDTTGYFSCYEEDLWTYITKFLDGKSLVMLAATNKWFNTVIMQDSIWKFACLRDLQIADSCNVSHSWIHIYASAFDGSHSFFYHEQQKHIDWMRIGGFYMASGVALLTERLGASIGLPRVPKEGTAGDMLKLCGSCTLKNIKTGIWIADLQLVRCPVCELDTCDGTMQTLEARHIELFLNKGYKDGIWQYDLIGSQKTKEEVCGARGAILDLNCLNDSSTSGIFNVKSWMGKHDDYQPKAILALHGVAINTNLQKNDGVLVRYQAMRAGDNGEIVAIRISQQLL